MAQKELGIDPANHVPLTYVNQGDLMYVMHTLLTVCHLIIKFCFYGGREGLGGDHVKSCYNQALAKLGWQQPV